MNRRTCQSALDKTQCRAIEHAWHQAAKDGHPLNAMITIRPLGGPTSLEQATLVATFWNRLGIWCRRVTKAATGEAAFYCILVREAAPNTQRNEPGLGEHFHVLVHVPPGSFAALKAAIARWYPSDDVHVRPAHQGVSQTDWGKIRSAIGYLTKQRTPQAWWRTRYRRQQAGGVLGKRFRLTANLRGGRSLPAQPAENSVITAA